MIGQIFSIASERQRMAFLKFIRGHLHIYLSLVLRYFYSSPETINSTLDLVLLRKAIGAEALAAQREAVLSGKYPKLESKLRELKMLHMQIGQQTLAGRTHGEAWWPTSSIWKN